ncbi:glycosyltransferase [Bacillus sp. JZ8]
MSEFKKRVLVGSPVHQKPSILEPFLHSLQRLTCNTIDIHFFFIDDNENNESSAMLTSFQETTPNVKIESSQLADVYLRDERTHYWNDRLVWKVAGFKNHIINHCLEEKYDYLFLIDSDLLLEPETVEHLIQTEKDIVSEVFWTRWQPNTEPLPQVWLMDEYTQWEQRRGEELTEEGKYKRHMEFINKLKEKGLYEVGGLGACTLLSRKALEKGVNFKQIKNLSFWGEDRHFCIRAAALGISLYVDTHMPAFHIYRDSDLAYVDEFMTRKKTNVYIKGKNKLTLSMVVKNEGNRYLKEALEQHKKFIDEAVIIDDGSTDNTVDICLETLKGIPVHIIQNAQSKFSNEVELRKQQWEETVKRNPDWILNLDADEIFETGFASGVKEILEQTKFDVVCFRLYDFWNKTHYREDMYWRAHLTYRPFLVRYRKDFNYVWKETAQHCGRLPENIFELKSTTSNWRLKHFGWATKEERLTKYRRYIELDPESKYGWHEQYVSILDEHPNLIEWTE